MGREEQDAVIINAGVKTQRYRNLKRDPRVALCVIDVDDPYKKVLIRGRATEIAREGGDGHLDKLSMKYWGMKYPLPKAADSRIEIRTEPEHVTH